jgi:hypothetical protein
MLAVKKFMSILTFQKAVGSTCFKIIELYVPPPEYIRVSYSFHDEHLLFP